MNPLKSMVEASEIVPRLWQGSRPAPGYLVAQAGFNVLVLCAREYQPEASAFPGVEVIHAPNDDAPSLYPFTEEDLKAAITASARVVKAYKQGQNILITCAAGLNRSGLVTAISLHRLFGWDGQTCIRKIRKQRKPRHGIQPLSNHEFTKALRRLPAHP